MGNITTAQRKVYRAPTAGRAFLTLRAAARAEARAMMRKKYPGESPEPEVGFPGWWWTEDERLVRAYERLARQIHKRSRDDG